MLTIPEQMTLALTCYNEDRFESICKEMFPLAVFHKRKTDTEFFGWLDHGNRTASVWMEGTHGKGLINQIIAWAGNLMASDNDGNNQADGFQAIAGMIDTLIGEKLAGSFDTIYFFGHSRACAVLAILALLLLKRNTKLKISGRVFCPPTAGNREFAKGFNSAVPDWIFYRMKGDLINSKLMRNEKSEMLDGVDNGLARDLPRSG